MTERRLVREPRNKPVGRRAGQKKICLKMWWDCEPGASDNLAILIKYSRKNSETLRVNVWCK